MKRIPCSSCPWRQIERLPNVRRIPHCVTDNGPCFAILNLIEEDEREKALLSAA